MVFPFHARPDCGSNATTHQFDLCTFMFGQPIPDCPIAMISDFVFFDRTIFPPPVCLLTSDLFQGVRSALEVAAIQAGFELVSQGAAHSKTRLASMKFPDNIDHPFASIRFTCNRFRKHTTVEPSLVNVPKLQCTSLHNNKKGNSRGIQGLGAPRKRTSQKSFTNEFTCSFNIQFFVCKNGFFIKKLPRGQT